MPRSKVPPPNGRGHSSRLGRQIGNKERRPLCSWTLDNTLIIATVFAVVILAVIVAYRRRIKAGVTALGAEFNVEAEGRSEPPVSSAPPTAASAAPPAGRAVLAEGERSVALGGSADGANIVTGSGNTFGEERQRKR